MIIRKNTPSIRSDRPVKTFGNNMVSRPETGRSVSPANRPYPERIPVFDGNQSHYLRVQICLVHTWN